MDSVTRPGEREATEGARSIKRAASVLRSLASCGRSLSVSEVGLATGLHRATAHRMLRVLSEEGLVEQDAQSRKYRLGMEIFAMSATMGNRIDLRTIAQPSIERLCRATEDTVYLIIRNGYDGLCLDMREGAFPERTLKLSVGDRWPLGVGASNMPLLAFLPDSEVSEIIAHNVPRLSDYSEYAPERLLDGVEETRARGFAIKVSHWYPKMCGVGVPVLDGKARPIAALSITGILSRMPGERQAELAALLKQEADVITRCWEDARSITPDRESWRFRQVRNAQPSPDLGSASGALKPARSNAARRRRPPEISPQPENGRSRAAGRKS